MDKLVYSKEIPPVYQQLHDMFGVEWEDGLIIAWDGKIHCKETPYPQKWIHEEVHLIRQKEIGNEAWWRLYMENPEFRFDEELLAYRAETDFLKKNVSNREDCFQMIRLVARSFSSGIYGNLLTTEEAFRLIR